MSFSQDPIHNLENLIHKNKTKSISIYLVIVVALVVFISSLPLIKIDISSQSRGVIRSTTDNVPLTSLVNGKVVYVHLKNNWLVQKGDTLIQLNQESLNSEQYTNESISSDLQTRIRDLSSIVTSSNAVLTTPELQQELNSYNSKKSELESKITQAKIVYDRYKHLFDKGIIAKAEFEKYSFDYTYSKQSLSSLFKSQKSVWQNQKRDLQNQLKNLKGTLNKINAESKN